MIFIFGRGSGESVLGYRESCTCKLCGNTSRQSIKVLYNYLHLFYIVSSVFSREYARVCPICNHRVPLEKSFVTEQYPKDTVPFIRKKGWLLSLGLLVAFAAYAVYASSKERTILENIASTPQINDIYQANLARIKFSGYTSATDADGKKIENAFGLLKLVKIQEDSLYFILSYEAFTKKTALRKAMHDKDEGLAFDTEYELVLRKEDLLTLAKRSIIFDANREDPTDGSKP